MTHSTAISIEELRSNLAEIVNRVTYAKDRVLVKKYNKASAIIISLDEYERLIDPIKRLSKAQWQKRVKKIDKIRAQIPKVNSENLDDVIDETVAQVRAENKR